MFWCLPFRVTQTCLKSLHSLKVCSTFWQMMVKYFHSSQGTCQFADSRFDPHLNSTVLYLTILYCTILYCTGPRWHFELLLIVGWHTVRHYSILYCTILWCTVGYCNLLLFTILCCSVLYCIVLIFTVLYLGDIFELLLIICCRTRRKRART